MIKGNFRLLSHDAGADGGPLRVGLTDALLCSHRDVQLLVLAEEHDSDRVFLLAKVVLVLHANNGAFRVNATHVLTCHELLLSIWRARCRQSEADRTLGAHTLTRTLFMSHVLINRVRNQRYQSKSVRYKLVMQG